MIKRQRMTTIGTAPKTEDAAPDLPTQRKPPEIGHFRLQVDRQTKASYPTYEAAYDAGLVIKQAHPIVQVAVYDTAEGLNKIIELGVTEELRVTEEQ
jgi:hypothetical protein